jgi:hypothetical protein
MGQLSSVVPRTYSPQGTKPMHTGMVYPSRPVARREHRHAPEVAAGHGTEPLLTPEPEHPAGHLAQPAPPMHPEAPGLNPHSQG